MIEYYNQLKEYKKALQTRLLELKQKRIDLLENNDLEYQVIKSMPYSDYKYSQLVDIEKERNKILDNKEIVRIQKQLLSTEKELIKLRPNIKKYKFTKVIVVPCLIIMVLQVLFIIITSFY